MFDISLESSVEIIVRTTLIYLVILIGLRIAGKREIGQMTVFDLVVLLLIANGVQNAMVGQDTSLIGGVIAAMVLLVINGIVAQARMRSTTFRKIVEGTPTVLVSQGKAIDKNLHREGIDANGLEAAIREHGVANVEDVEIAVLETDGTISVVPKGQQVHRVHHASRFLRR